MLCAGAAGLSHIACTERVPLMSPLHQGWGVVVILTAGILQESLDRSLDGSGSVQSQLPVTQGSWVALARAWKAAGWINLCVAGSCH